MEKIKVNKNTENQLKVISIKIKVRDHKNKEIIQTQNNKKNIKTFQKDNPTK